MFEINHNDQSFRIKMSATLENIDTADDKLAEYLTDRKIPVDVFALRIILRESLLNAVTHGSGVNPEENVSFDLNIDSSKVTVKVNDNGRGFNWREHTYHDDNLSEGGRGLALMKIYSDNMEFNESGNEVTLCKHIKVASSVSE
ncbi:MAG: ATP-binding protein [Sedimentisphaerales bacterium]|nr:ATP-binding protein [Sedimentisphaerales bacterium]